MASKEKKTRSRAATTIREEGRAHGALAGREPGAVCVEIPAAVYIQLCAGARLVADSTDAYFAKMWESEIEGLLDVAQIETGKREIPMTRHERRAFERLRETSRA